MNLRETEDLKLLVLFFDIADQLRDRSFFSKDSSRLDLVSGLTVRQNKVIKAVSMLTSALPDGISLKELAEELQLSPGTTSETVETLVQQDMLERNQCPHDRRAVRIKLSASGLNLIDAGKRRLINLFEKVGATLTDDEQRQLIVLLTKIQNRFNEMENDHE